MLRDNLAGLIVPMQSSGTQALGDEFSYLENPRPIGTESSLTGRCSSPFQTEPRQVHSEQNVYTEYADPKRSEWIIKIQPALKKARLRALVEACRKRLSRREIIELRAGRKKPHRKTQELLVAILKELGHLQ